MAVLYGGYALFAWLLETFVVLGMESCVFKLQPFNCKRLRAPPRQPGPTDRKGGTRVSGQEAGRVQTGFRGVAGGRGSKNSQIRAFHRSHRRRDPPRHRLAAPPSDWGGGGPPGGGERVGSGGRRPDSGSTFSQAKQVSCCCTECFAQRNFLCFSHKLVCVRHASAHGESSLSSTSFSDGAGSSRLFISQGAHARILFPSSSPCSPGGVGTILAFLA